MSMLPPRSGSRLAVLFCLVLATLFLPGVVLAAALPALSPFLLLSTLLATHVAGVPVLCAVPVLALVLWRRRGFCLYGCPVGWMVDVCAKARPSAKATYLHVPHIGQWLALLTLGGALAACPLFIFLDPLAMFVAATGTVQSSLSPAYAVCFALVIALSLVFPFLWCRRLCPLGATQELLSELKEAVARRRARHSGQPLPPGNTALARRAFLGVSGGMVSSLLAIRAPREIGVSTLRPPGAAGEIAMRALCIRCGNCVRTCPTRIIQPDLDPPSVSALLVPTLRFDKDWCLDTCNECGRTCPTGTIASLPLAEKNERRIGLASVEQAACLLTIEKECVACTTICKRRAIVEEFYKATYTTAVRIDAHQCNGCGACVAVCPEKAITVRSR